MLTFDVEFWSIRSRKGRRKPFELRWRVGTQPHSKSYKTYTQADGRRAELLAALQGRQQFDEETGLPAAELEALNCPTWYDHAVAYALMKWPKAAAKQRANIAESLAGATPAFVSTRRAMPDSRVMRHALHSWAFRAIRTSDGTLVSRAAAEEPPADVAAALTWLAKHSLRVTEAANPVHLRAALDALSLKLDGTQAAETTIHRKVMVLSNAWRYAMETGAVAYHPMKRIDWSPPQLEDEIDFEYVPDPQQAEKLLKAVKGQGLRGEHLYAFFGCLYYAAMRPSEIADLKESHCTLPESGWGELVLRGNRPEVGSGWTDDGNPYEERGLKRRARRTTRSVPIPPVLVAMLRAHIARYGTASDGRLFQAARGGRVRSTEYTEVWQEARRLALTPEEVAAGLASVAYCLRAAAIMLWILAGVHPVEAARRAGHSVAVLYRFYAKILRGSQAQANKLIEQRLSEAVTAPSDPAG
ncbi:tyrosine-type recombinase/integrase [Streptomyces chrestomyceticus]|uniref:tyrosine-type recombinase/integrase n=1 Tax=Streptomyces chrestomyceticus TaxID=68185 RepID=UPI0033E3035E